MEVVGGALDCAERVWRRRHGNSRKSARHVPIPSLTAQDLPYVLRKTDQFALDDILRAKMMTYDHIQLSNWTIDWKAHDEPDFVFLPFLSAMHGENYDCGDAPVFAATIANATAEIVKLAEEVNKGYDYPRLIIALGVIRLSQGVRLLTEELMKTLSDKVSRRRRFPPADFFPRSSCWGSRRTRSPSRRASNTRSTSLTRRGSISRRTRRRTGGTRATRTTSSTTSVAPCTLLHCPRARLTRRRVHYAGSSTHPWNVHVDDGIKGFAVRAVLATTLQTHIDEELAASNRGEVRSTTKVIFDDFARMDGTYDFANRAYDHMLNSVFTLEPAGDTPTRRGFYDAIALGTIPVVFRNSTYARLLPSSPEMDTSLYTIVLDERELIDGVGLDVIQRLELIPQSVIRQKQLAIQAIQRKMQYSFPSVDTVLPVTQQTRSSMLAPSMMEVGEDAFSMILRELDTIKNGEWKHRS